MAQFQAGFAKQDITPPLGHPMSGYVIRTLGAASVHDSLFARALALSDGTTCVLILVLDLIGVDAALVSDIRMQIHHVTNVAQDHIAIVATHTHAGPAILRDSFLGSVDTDYQENLCTRVTQAAQKALDALQPVDILVSSGRESLVAHNRRIKGGLIDPELPVLRFETARGLCGLFTSYACHPVTLGPNNLSFSRDYPGFLTDTLEELYPEINIMFATGCCGQINTPGHSAEDSIKGVGLEARTFAEAKRLGRLLASEALHVSEALANPLSRQVLEFAPMKVKHERVTLKLKPPVIPDEQTIREKEAELKISNSDAERAVLEAYLNWAKTQDWQRQEVSVEVMCILMGQLCWAFFPGEVFVEHGLELKATFPELKVITLAYANGAPGYIPHHTAYSDGGYEVEEAFRYYGYPSVYREDSGDRVLEVLSRLIREG